MLTRQENKTGKASPAGNDAFQKNNRNVLTME